MSGSPAVLIAIAAVVFVAAGTSIAASRPTAHSSGTSAKIAYAHIEPGIRVTQAQGITDADVSHPSDALYCIKGLPFTPKNAQVTVDTGATYDGYGQVMVGEGHDFCTDPETQVEVFIRRSLDSEINVGLSMSFYLLVLG